MATYPIPVFYYSVSFTATNGGPSIGGGKPVGFSEISGLSQEHQAIEYRDGLMNGTTLPLKFPGLKKAGNITLKRGMTQDPSTANDFYNWLNNFGKAPADSSGAPYRYTVTIQLMTDADVTAFTWTVIEAWPVKIEGPGLKASDNSTAIESIELVHEGISLKAAS